MQELAAFKPLLTALLMPPTGPLLLVALGWWCLVLDMRRLAGLWVLVGGGLLWVASCNGAAVWMAANLAGQPAPTTPALVKAAGAQAVVVLGGGVEPLAPEYASAQLHPESFQRLRYGAYLARQTGLPLAYSGGVGWGGFGPGQDAEAVVAARIAPQEYQVPVAFAEAQSRDTRENARMSWQLLSPQKITHVALVTNAWHTRRAERAYREAGFTVTAAPMGYIQPEAGTTLEWLPTAVGLGNSRTVLREWLGYQLGH